MSKPTNNYLAQLLEVPLVQRLNLQLIEAASLRSIDGRKIVKDLLAHRDLWQACLMDNMGSIAVKDIGRFKTADFIDLLKLRGMDDETVERLGFQPWHVDTLFILAKKEHNDLLYMIAKDWGADKIEWLPKGYAQLLLNGGSIPKLLRLKWN